MVIVAYLVLIAIFAWAWWKTMDFVDGLIRPPADVARFSDVVKESDHGEVEAEVEDAAEGQAVEEGVLSMPSEIIETDAIGVDEVTLEAQRQERDRRAQNEHAERNAEAIEGAKARLDSQSAA